MSIGWVIFFKAIVLGAWDIYKSRAYSPDRK